MKKFILFVIVIFCGSTIAQSQTISYPQTKSTITPKQIKDVGQQYQYRNNGVIVLDFEGLGNHDPINNFYNGGTSGFGNSGANYGVEFGVAIGLIDFDEGGTGNFANEPSPSTVMFFLDDNQAYMNVTAGFTTGFSFYYSSWPTFGAVSVYDGLNGTGYLLATVNLPSNFNLNCTGDPDGQACNWDPIGVAFDGTAKSVVFIGAANLIGFDDVTFGSIAPGGSSCEGNKVEICHIPPGNPNNPQTLCVSYNALAAHLAHGDFIGSCQVPQMLGDEEDEELNMNFMLYPNPTERNVTLSFNVEGDGSYIIEIVDMTGRKLFSFEGKSSQGKNTRELSLENIVPGMYQVALILDGNKEMRKLMVR